MIKPWQVWLADLETLDGDKGRHPVLVVSSEVHLRSQSGRGALVCPITSESINVRNHIAVAHPDREAAYVMTEQFRYLNTNRFTNQQPWWTLDDDEIHQIRQVLPFMLDL